MSVVWQSISSSNFPGLYAKDNSFPASRIQTTFTKNYVNRLGSAADDFNIVPKNDTVRVEQSSIPIIVVEKAKTNTNKVDDSRVAEKISEYVFGNNPTPEPLFDTISWSPDKDDYDKKKNKKKKRRHTKKHKYKLGHGGGPGSEEKYCDGKGYDEKTFKKYMMTMMVGVMSAKAMILPIVLKMLAIFSVKGFLLSILAIIVGSVLVVKKFTEPHQDHGGDTKVEIVPMPLHDNYHHYTKHDEVIHEGKTLHPYKFYY